MELQTKLSLEQIQDSDNINELLSEDDSKAIGYHCVHNYDVDKQSRLEWEKRMKAAEDLALQVVEEKSTPWENASNVKFPLLTIASLQFQSRAYPALVKAPDLVKYRVQGKDEGGIKAAKAQRISAHMSYQLLEEDEGWEEAQDKAFLALPIVGCVFKKTYYDNVKGFSCSKLVLPKSLVVHYYAKSLEECERKTEIFQLYSRQIRERELRKVFSTHDYGPAPALEPKDEDKRQGTVAPIDDKDRPREFLEQHCYLDLDGDGYKEPYVVTVDKATKKVARIVARIDYIETEQSVAIDELQKRITALAEGVQQPENPTPEDTQQAQMVLMTIERMQAEIEELAKQPPKVLSIKPIEYYTKYSFIPSPDGGFYDLGFGALLGPLNDSVNTLINQLIDSGSLNNSNSGFIGKGARLKGGKLRFKMNEWIKVNVTGASLRDNLVPLESKPPSPVLYQLLSLLISYSERVGSVTDTMMGENPGQNTPAYNMSAMLEQGLQVFNGIFKRVYRSFRSELRKKYRLNAIYLDNEEYFAYQDSESKVLRVDYTGDEKDLIPAADPNAFSNKEKMTKAQTVAEMSQVFPGFDPIKVVQRQLEALDIPDAAEVFPLVPEMDEEGNETGAMTYKFPPQPDPEFEIKRAEEQRRSLESQTRAEIGFIEAESKLMVAEADVVLKMAQAGKLGEDSQLEKFELILKEIQDKRKDLTEREKIDATKRARVGGESSQRGSD